MLAKDARYACSRGGMLKHWRWFSLGALTWLAACGGDSGSPLRVGRDDGSGRAGAGGTGALPSGGAAGIAGASAGGSSRNPLSVDITDIAAMEIEIVTLSCAGECAEVQAVARGGNPPYTFAWSDGLTDPTRNLCPNATTSFEVTAKDTPIETDEFAYAGMSETARVTANVLDCTSDGGMPAIDGSVQQPMDGCIALTSSDELPPWQRCPPSPELIHPITGARLADCETSFPDERHVDSYMRFAVYDGAPAEQESLGGKLCVPLRAGVAVDGGLFIGGGITAPDGSAFLSFDTTFDIELWGGSSPCSTDELLWSTNGVFFGSGTDACFSLTPERDHAYVHSIIRARAPAGAIRDGCIFPAFVSPGGVCL